MRTELGKDLLRFATGLQLALSLSTSPKYTPNWAGYIVETDFKDPQKGTIQEIQGTWIIPAALGCTNEQSYVMVWIGFDGNVNKKNVEQIGTRSECAYNTDYYQAWYEMYPNPPQIINLSVYPGDVVSAKVKYLKENHFELEIEDITTGEKQTIIDSSDGERYSAEAIVEKIQEYPLTHFGTISFLDISVKVNNITGTINNPNWQYDSVTQISDNHKLVPSELSKDGSSFNVAER